MSVCYKIIRVFVFLLFITFSVHAQQASTVPTITIDIKNQTLATICGRINQSHPVKIYFQPERLPAALVTFSFVDASVDSVIRTLLAGTPLDFFEYRGYGIIIAPKDIVQTVYSPAYYQIMDKELTKTTEVLVDRSTISVGNDKIYKSSGKAKVTGTILHQKDKSPVIGATVKVANLNTGTTTDEKGSFELELPIGLQQLIIHYIGNADLIQDLKVYHDGQLNLTMESEAIKLGEVVISARAADANVEQVQIGVTQLDVKTIHKLPSFLGESDVIKSLLLSPGVSTIGEGATGFNVRGGEVDQNLMMHDDAVLFNSSHALGFFSTYHTELISKVSLYKSIIPAQYGGRLASVLDVEMRDGSFDKYMVKASVGPVSSRVAFEGPILKDKSSFILGFRSSYSDWVLKQAKNVEVRNSSAFFYDANFRYAHRINSKNFFSISGYGAQDEFIYNKTFGFDYQTRHLQATYKTIFSQKLYSKLSAVISRYKSLQSDFVGIDAAQLNNRIEQLNLKEQLSYTPRKNLQWVAGFAATLYRTLPGAKSPLGEFSRIFSKNLDLERGLESAVFINADWTATPRIEVSGGIRLSMYQFLGPGTSYTYADPETKTIQNIKDSVRYSHGKVIAKYGGLEPRISVRYKLNPESSIKWGYTRTVQYINQIYNSDAPTPTSQFQLSTEYIEPTRSHNISIGYFRNYNANTWETSLELYARAIDKLFDYKDFAELTVNDHLETEILPGRGRAYGAELSIKKNKGILNGALGYTLSRTERLVDGINRNQWYPNNFDKPHDFNLVLNHNYNQRHTLTMNFTYSTGRPTTAPVGGYRLLNGLPVPIYSDRNALRIPDYHRLDLAYTLGKGYRKDKKFKTSWSFSIYNVYARKNAFSVFFTQSPFTAGQANRLAILGSVFPSVTFNIETQ